MTVEEIFSTLAAHMIKGLMVHDQMANAYGFLNLCGYKKCHEYHYFAESKNYRHLYNYYLTHYHKLLPEQKIEDPQIIPTTWLKYTKMDVDANTKRTAVKDLMKKWADWEKETKALLEKSYKELCDLGEVCAAEKVLCFLHDVSRELKYIQEKTIDMEVLNYDIGGIIKSQEKIYEKYCRKFKYLFADKEHKK